MVLSEQVISFLEEHIPELASVAFTQAYSAALAAGSSVLISEKGDLIEVFPDGTHKFIKRLPLPRHVLFADKNWKEIYDARNARLPC